MGILRDMKEAYPIFRERDPAIRSYWDVVLYPCFHAIRSYRRAHRLWLAGHTFRARAVSQRAARRTGIEIHPAAVIGKGFFIDHGTGVVIGETAEIGDNVTLYQGVTLGGTGKEHGKRHPTLEDGVMVSAGAKVLGSITIGKNTKIGAGSVVIDPVPPNCTVVGVPGRIVRIAGAPIPRESLAQDLPDPVLDDIRTLANQNAALKNRVTELERVVSALLPDAGPSGKNGAEV
ncbi:MAG: serine O-acetyltransferase [Lachnospiraceae bacterium]|nr:serine O-acetyltransferase [Lachnospiraceae bacterium]